MPSALAQSRRALVAFFHYMYRDYFAGKERPPLPQWEQVKPLLPQPILEGNEAAIAACWKGWELTIASLRQPTPENGFVSNYFLPDFNNCIFAHDAATICAGALYAHRAFSPLESLDNFYVKQHETGEICREIDAGTGGDVWVNQGGDPMRVIVGDIWEKGPADFVNTQHYWWTRPTVGTHPPSRCSIDALNDPSCMALVEWDYYIFTGDVERIRRSLPVHKDFFEAFQVYLRAENGLYITDWASMDNSPRNLFLGYGVDVASGTATLAQVIADMCGLVGDRAGAEHYEGEARAIRKTIREKMWDPERRFFMDLDRDDHFIPIKTAAGFLPLIARACTEAQTRDLAAELDNPRTFNRPVRIPSLAADEPQYTPGGSYYWGGVWMFLNRYIVRGLESSGLHKLATDIAINHWSAMVQVFENTGSLWEYLSPEKVEPGTTAQDPGKNARPELVGLGTYPVTCGLLEYAIGLRPHAPSRTLVWNLRETNACGCKQFVFGDVITDLLCQRRSSHEEVPVLSVKTDRPYRLIIRWGGGNEKILNVT